MQPANPPDLLACEAAAEAAPSANILEQQQQQQQAQGIEALQHPGAGPEAEGDVQPEPDQQGRTGGYTRSAGGAGSMGNAATQHNRGEVSRRKKQMTAGMW
ncbi:hypothetical protein PLESTB_001408500 [Pleodorina starrii]|uniref:Uncharacterized protein n=1 Tax=Pleodorina starrii TaxID=330485 RepID=A0A9W6F721_9CHLO|nr:hypothetical protein PLESTB_001408500 [Pleodorina starrii]